MGDEPNKDNDSSAEERRRVHDIKQAIRTLRLAMEQIKGGYRFDDRDASLKIATMERCINTLEKYCTP